MILFCKNLLAVPTYRYSGVSESRMIEHNGLLYTLVTLLSSGVFIPHRNIDAEIWMCGGGSSGSLTSGGGGGYFYPHSFARKLTSKQEYAAHIGEGGVRKAGGYTSFADAYVLGGGISIENTGLWALPVQDKFLNRPPSGNGCTGGGCSHNAPYTSYKGKQYSSYPFFDSENFKPHCAGGGGCSLVDNRVNRYTCGGVGGTNGQDGGFTQLRYVPDFPPALGGEYGGGTGGIERWTRNEDGTNSLENIPGQAGYFFGGGGGGGSKVGLVDVGDGYQGVIYLRFRAEETLSQT